VDKKESIVTALVSIVLGLLLIIMRANVIKLAVTIVGVVLIVWAIRDFINKLTNTGIIKAVIGACVLIFGWMFIGLALYILAAALIIMGLLKIVNTVKYGPRGVTVADNVIIYAKPVITALAGACLLFNQGGTISWVFIITGIMVVISGVLEIVELCKN
jgi:hypothetical protein